MGWADYRGAKDARLGVTFDCGVCNRTYVGVLQEGERGDGLVVFTHRDPVQTLASLCALTEQYRAARYDTNDRSALGREMLRFVTAHIDRFMTYRDSVDGEGIIDVNYYRLVADPVKFIGEDLAAMTAAPVA